MKNRQDIGRTIIGDCRLANLTLVEKISEIGQKHRTIDHRMENNIKGRQIWYIQSALARRMRQVWSQNFELRVSRNFEFHKIRGKFPET